MRARSVTAWPATVSGEPISVENQLAGSLLGRESSCFGSCSSMRFHAASRWSFTSCLPSMRAEDVRMANSLHREFETSNRQAQSGSSIPLLGIRIVHKVQTIHVSSRVRHWVRREIIRRITKAFWSISCAEYATTGSSTPGLSPVPIPSLM